MTLKQLRHAYSLYSNPLASRETIRHNVKAYCKALQVLGDKYILAKPIHLVKRGK